MGSHHSLYVPVLCQKSYWGHKVMDDIARPFKLVLLKFPKVLKKSAAIDTPKYAFLKSEDAFLL